MHGCHIHSHAYKPKCRFHHTRSSGRTLSCRLSTLHRWYVTAKHLPNDLPLLTLRLALPDPLLRRVAEADQSGRYFSYMEDLFLNFWGGLGLLHHSIGFHSRDTSASHGSTSILTQKSRPLLQFIQSSSERIICQKCSRKDRRGSPIYG